MLIQEFNLLKLTMKWFIEKSTLYGEIEIKKSLTKLKNLFKWNLVSNDQIEVFAGSISKTLEENRQL